MRWTSQFQVGCRKSLIDIYFSSNPITTTCASLPKLNLALFSPPASLPNITIGPVNTAVDGSCGVSIGGKPGTIVNGCAFCNGIRCLLCNSNARTRLFPGNQVALCLGSKFAIFDCPNSACQGNGQCSVTCNGNAITGIGVGRVL